MGDYDRRGGGEGHGRYDEDRGEDRGGFGSRRRKVSPFYTELNANLDYRDAAMVKHFITERGKVVPRRISKLSAKHQRQVTKAIKRARALGLVPYVTQG